jgi:hypothetical protein
MGEVGEGIRRSGMRGEGGRRLTRYQPVGLPVSPSLLWEVRTTRILGESAILSEEIVVARV